MSKAAVQMPGEEEPFALWALWVGMRRTAACEAHTGEVPPREQNSQCWFRSRRKRAETSLGAADISVCATDIVQAIGAFQ